MEAGEDHELSRKRWTEGLQPRCLEEAERREGRQRFDLTREV